MTVNHWVGGSSPPSGAKHKKPLRDQRLFLWLVIALLIYSKQSLNPI